MNIKTRLKESKNIIILIPFVIVLGLIFLIIKPVSDTQKSQEAENIPGNFPDGVLAVNSDKITYIPNETALIQMGVLDSNGDTICDADLTLTIKNNSGDEQTFEGDQIRRSLTCGNNGDNTVTNNPDYFLEYKIEKVGDYTVTLKNPKTGKTTQNKFTVTGQRNLDIVRETATRINPFKADRYPVVLRVTAEQDYSGKITDRVPEEFTILWQGPATLEKVQGADGKEFTTISWNVTLKAGETTELIYEYSAPQVSPEFYVIGTHGEWQIASDDVSTVQTAMYVPGSQGQSVILTLGTAPTPGNILVAFTAYSQYPVPAGRVLSAPDGTWTKVDDATVGAVSLSVWWKTVIPSGTQTTYTFSISGSIEWQSGVIYEISGADTNDPINQHSIVTQSSTSVTTIATTPITPSVLGTLALAATGTDNGSTGTPTGMTATVSPGWTIDRSAVPQYHAAFTASRDALTSDTTTPISTTFTFSKTSGVSAAAAILIAPAPPPPEIRISGTSDLASGSVAVAINNAVQPGVSATISGGTWVTNTLTPPSNGDVITVWVDGAAQANRTSAVTKYDGSGDITGMVLDRHVVSVGSNDNQALTLANLDQYDNGQDSDIIYGVTGSVLTIDPGGISTTEKLNILSGNSLTVGSTQTLNTNNIDINGTLTSTTTATYNITGAWVNNGTFTQATSTVNMNGAAAQTIGGTSSTTFNNLTMGASSIVSLLTNTSVAGNLTLLTGATFDLGSYTANRLSAGGTLTLNADSNLKIGGTGTLPSNYNTHSINASSIVEFTGGSQSIPPLNSSQSYGNLITSGSGTKSLSNNITISGSLTVGGGTTLDTTASNRTLTANNVTISPTGTLNIRASTFTITGNSGTLFTNSGTFTAGSNSTTTFTGAGSPSALLSGTFTGTSSFFNLNLSPTIAAAVTYNMGAGFNANGSFTINPTASSTTRLLTVNLGGNSTVVGTTNITGTTTGTSLLDTVNGQNYTFSTGSLNIGGAGTLTARASDINLTGTSGTIFTRTGTFNQGTSTVNYTQTAGNTTLTSGAVTFHNLAINMFGRTGSSGGNITVNNDLTVNAGVLSVPSNYTLAVTGNTSITGGLTMSSSGNQTFTGPVTINTGGTLTRSNASGTNTFVSLLTISNGGTFTTTSNPSFILQGGLLNDGTFTSGSGTYTFNTNNQSISGSAATTFGGGVAISGAVTLQNASTNTVTITGNLTGSVAGSTYLNNADTITDFKGAVLTTGTLDAGASPNTIRYTGSTAQTVKGTTYHHLQIQPSANSVTTLLGSGNFTINGNLTLGNGTNTGVVIQATTNDPNILVLGDVTVNANTTFTNSDSASATLDIDGDLTITGSFTAPRGANDDSFTLGGNFIKTGTFTHNNGQITFDTTEQALLDYSSDTTFYQFSVLPASAGKILSFDETYTTIISNDITIQGTNCTIGRIYLESAVESTPWKINILSGATQDIDFVALKDADGTSSQVTPVAHSSSQTASTGWTVTDGLCDPAAAMMNFEGVDMSGMNIN